MRGPQSSCASRAFVGIAVFVVLCACLGGTEGCQQVTEGFYDPETLQYRNVAWESQTAPRRAVRLEAELFKQTPQSPFQFAMRAQTGGNTDWRPEASISLYVSSACDERSLVEQRHGSLPDGGYILALNGTSHIQTACSGRYWVASSVSWDGGQQALALAINGSRCFAKNVCCLSAGTCNQSPHSICTDRGRCVESGHSVNETVTCPSNEQVCCVLSPQLPPPPPPTSPSGKDRPESQTVNDTALAAYIIICLIGLAAMGGGYYYYYYQKRLEHTGMDEVEML